MTVVPPKLRAAVVQYAPIIGSYWPVVLSILALIVWLVRLEARVNHAATDVDKATISTQISDVKDRVARIENKLDQLLSRGK